MSSDLHLKVIGREIHGKHESKIETKLLFYCTHLWSWIQYYGPK